MAQSHETSEWGIGRYTYRHPEWERELISYPVGDSGEDADGTGSDLHDYRIPEFEELLGAGPLNPAVAEGNGNGKPAGSGGADNFESPGPHFMPSELAQPLGGLSVRASEVIG